MIERRAEPRGENEVLVRHVQVVPEFEARPEALPVAEKQQPAAKAEHRRPGQHLPPAPARPPRQEKRQRHRGEAVTFSGRPDEARQPGQKSTAPVGADRGRRRKRNHPGEQADAIKITVRIGSS